MHKMISTTPSILERTSLFQNRITCQPCRSSQAVRQASAALSACWPPSISITKPCLVQAKSAMKPPIGCCRRNLYCDERRSRRADHRRRSAAVEFSRSQRAFRVGGFGRRGTLMPNVPIFDPRFSPHPPPPGPRSGQRHPLPHDGGRGAITLLDHRQRPRIPAGRQARVSSRKPNATAGAQDGP